MDKYTTKIKEVSVSIEFKPFPKLARLNRDIVITEKIDGTNAQVCITEEGQFLTGSRTRWITPEDDNFGFAKWANDNKEELLKLGPGQHFGEWYGGKIQRGYGLKEKRFALFNVGRWNKDNIPACCSLVPILYQGLYHQDAIELCLVKLQQEGSLAVPGFQNPEGIVIFHTASRQLYKVTLKDDQVPKSLVKGD